MSLTMEDPMDDRRFVTKLVNPLGTTRWQPTLPNGVKAWIPAVQWHPWHIEWLTEDDTHFSLMTQGPRLYRSRARAVRVAKRQWVKLVENQWENHPTQTV